MKKEAKMTERFSKNEKISAENVALRNAERALFHGKVCQTDFNKFPLFRPSIPFDPFRISEIDEEDFCRDTSPQMNCIK